ncbi:olfactory receptor class A-like protein 1 [Protopterus annectens]|uniref:olfactory receptor class A-like protein 1 n=1 Tax=Protopterus annectens TaxID=7888 RepID=UPI001CFB7A99|nr:olfactory receptor class A-like protein 1 [Protopterus annectens]
MEAYNIIKGTLFLVLLVTGIPGNLLISSVFFFAFITRIPLLLTEIIIFKITIINLLLILTRGLPVTLFLVFDLKNLFGDNGCKVIMYLARVSRAMAICSTCILVCIQCIILSPSSSRLFALKMKLSHYTLIAFNFVLILNMATEIGPPVFTTSELNSTDLEYTFYFGYCVVNFRDYITIMTSLFTLVSRDAIFVVMMASASANIMVMLLRHSKQIKRVKKDIKSTKNSAEIKAAKTVVILASLYVIFIGFETTILLYQVTVSRRIHPIVSDVRHFFSVCYASVFPSVVVISNKRIQSCAKCLF